jgi:hypothetical protein
VEFQPFARAISIDYSDDELDAISAAFLRRDIARRARADDADDPIRRAQNQTALRGLVARRAIMLGGTPARPRVTFLEPHATLLGAFLGADSIATIRHDERKTMRAVSLFVHGEIVVEQAAREGLAVQRMTAHDRAAAPELLRRELRLPPAAASAAGEEIELTRRMLTLTTAAVQRREDPPRCVPQRAADLLYARRSSGSVTMTSRDRSGTRSAEKWSWIDAGDLGLWRVVTDGDGPILRLVAAGADDLEREIDGAWRRVTDPG